MSNIIVATFVDGCTTAVTEAIYEGDYGMILQFSGLDLPDVYTVNFGNEAVSPLAHSMIGNADGVEIPNQLLTESGHIMAWVFLHTGEDDGETEYAVTIPVLEKMDTQIDDPTPEQESALNQAIAALNAGVERAETAADSAEQIAADLGDFETAMEAVTEAKNAAEQSASNASISAGSAAQSATNAAQSATDAAGSASAAATSATNAAASEAAARAVEESIPADYTALSEDVSDLKSIVDYGFTVIESINKIDPSKITVGYLGQQCVLNTSTGRITEFIKVKPNTVYSANNLTFGNTSVWVSWMFASDDLATKIDKIPDATFTTPSNCNYVRLVYSVQSGANSAMLVEGDTIPSTYVPYVEPHYDLSDDVKDVIDNTVNIGIENIIEISENEFFDPTFGRCIINSSNHTVTKNDNGNMYGSGFFRVYPNVMYKTRTWAKGFSFVYDKNMQFICTFEDDSRIAFAQKTTGTDTGWIFTVLDDVAYYVILTTSASGFDPDTAYIQVYSDEADVVAFPGGIDGAIKSASAINTRQMLGKKWAALGDSVTAGDGLANNVFTRYTTLVQKQCGVIAYNYGYSGSRIAVQGNPGTSTYDNAMVIRYASMIADADYITVLGGINDANNHLPLGTFGDTDIATFYGALDTLINGLLSKYPGKAIGFITFLHYGVSANHESYIHAIKEVCAKYAIPVLDMYNEGQLSTMTPELSTTYFSDGLHPNELGQSVMARKIANFLNRL